MVGTTTQIETGVETDNKEIRTTDADVMYYVDDGEYAEVTFVRRVDDTTVEIDAHFAEAGHREYIMTEAFDVDADKATKEWAREAAEADPELAIEEARKHFN